MRSGRWPLPSGVVVPCGAITLSHAFPKDRPRHLVDLIMRELVSVLAGSLKGSRRLYPKVLDIRTSAGVLCRISIVQRFPLDCICQSTQGQRLLPIVIR